MIIRPVAIVVFVSATASCGLIACTAPSDGAGAQGVQVNENPMDEWFAIYLAGIPSPDRQVTSAAMAEAQHARAAILEMGERAVGPLSRRWESSSFTEKDAAWDLVLEIGPAVVPELRRRAHELSPTARIWAASARHHFGDATAVGDLVAMLKSETPHVRHLAALALVFQGDVPPSAEEPAVAALVDALHSEAKLESTAFSVAGAALACLVAATGQPLLPPDKPIRFYNYVAFAFPPPVHPFPFASDYLGDAPPDERAAIVAAAEAWWNAPGRTLSLRPIQPTWPRAELDASSRP
ncbi:hypothetical protein predicted by Glimmer/Critica [Sorangium cellulosum So ce56]|uniref:HEAT repeat domain-containing protein n=1 Tax=Sorangium cellulosum (strain So ce56) TaxID=448385 RepID=A9FVE0_SORC5|nr:HEAT repeat domain-containing protein [Sorangium cellulosum]CAN92265.1 hypothetical protein predicted by Glimmer/Critica [Sorangium cellulosum So ce56]